MEKVEDVGCGVGGKGAKGGEGGSMEEQDGETKEAEEADRVATVEGDRNQGVGDETKNNSDEKTQEVGNRKRKRDTVGSLICVVQLELKRSSVYGQLELDDLHIVYREPQMREVKWRKYLFP